MAPDAAVMSVVPVDKLIASPVPPIVATLDVAEVQVTVLVKFCVEPSVKVPVAVKF
jgi:hypothetical protein